MKTDTPRLRFIDRVRLPMTGRILTREPVLMQSGMQERRREVRKRSYLGGRILYNRRFFTFDCVVRNLSPQGALLDFAGSITLPHAFDLQIEQAGIEMPVTVAWRTADRIGVTFRGAEAGTRPQERQAPEPEPELEPE